MAQILLKELTKVFKGNIVAVNNLNIEIEEGIVTSILGPSGCGKTTTMRLIAGFETPTAGRIFFDSRDVTELSPNERKIGMVFQIPVLYDDISVYDNIAMSLILKRESKAEIDRKVGEMCEFFDIPLSPNYLSKKGRNLTIAERQKVSLAHSFIVDREVYLLDEPLSNLDPKNRVEIRSKLKEYQNKAKKTIIYVTHDQTEAISLAEKIAIMREGSILQYDKTMVVYDIPKNAFVGWFLGNPGMNFIEGVKLSGSSLIIESLGLIFNLSSGKRAELSAFSELILGIRPEHIKVSSIPRDGFVEASCTLVEPIGSRIVLHLSKGEIKLRAKVEKEENLVAGKRLWFAFPSDKILLFKKENGDLVSIGI